jgi:hypothetical protein
MSMVEDIYQSATNAGLLKDCIWHPSDGAPAQRHSVGFFSPDDTVLEGMMLNTDFVMTFPASALKGIAQRDPVEIDGVTFLVRELRTVGDGSEMRATLTRV